MVNDGEHWRAAFEAALQTPNAGSWPFDLARIQLAYGERLRRALDTTRAKEVLHAALQTFDRLGALPWRERVSKGSFVPLGTHSFAQRERCQRRFSSRLKSWPSLRWQRPASATRRSAVDCSSRRARSVDTFTKPFPRLGVTSRAALRDALAEPTDT